MTIAATEGIIPYGFTHDASGRIITSNIIMDSAEEASAVVFQIPLTGTLLSVSIMTGAVTAAPTSELVDIKLEGVNTSTGEPSGTPYTTDSNATLAITNADDNVKFTSAEFGGGGGVSVTRGDLASVMVVNPSSNPGNWRFKGLSNYWVGLFPYGINRVTGTWTKTNIPGTFSLNYSGGVTIPIVGSTLIDDTTATTIKSDIPIAEAGLLFQFPHAVRIAGLMVSGDIDGPLDAHLYNSSANPQETGANRLATLTGVINGNVLRLNTQAWQSYMFPSSVLQPASTPYRLTLEAKTAVNSTINVAQVQDAADLGVFVGGTKFKLTEDNGTGGWDDNPSAHPWLIPLIDGFDDGAGGASGGVMPIGMRGLIG